MGRPQYQLQWFFSLATSSHASPTTLVDARGSLGVVISRSPKRNIDKLFTPSLPLSNVYWRRTGYLFCDCMLMHWYIAAARHALHASLDYLSEPRCR
jgi:hypothetical protein